MITQRYNVRREVSGTWTVFDVFTGLPAVVPDEGQETLAVGLSAEIADDLVDLLNLLDGVRRGVIQWPRGEP